MPSVDVFSELREELFRLKVESLRLKNAEYIKKNKINVSIEKNIPITKGVVRMYGELLNKLKKGESFKLPMKERLKLMRAIVPFHKTSKKRFRTKRIKKSNNFRVWRVL